MAQTMKEIIGDAYKDISEDKLRDFLPTIARNIKGDEFVKKDNDLSSMIRQCLDESSDSGMIGLLLPQGGTLKPFAVANRGGILGLESLDNGTSFGLGNRGKKALTKTLVGLIPLAQPLYNTILEESQKERERAKEEELAAKKAKQQQKLHELELKEKNDFKEKVIQDGDIAYKSLRTGRVFRPEMPEMLKTVMMAQAVAYGALDGKSIADFTAEFETQEMKTLFDQTAEFLDNEIAKRSQMAADALESKEDLWDFITAYHQHLQSMNLNSRDKLKNHGDVAFEELYNMDASDDAQLWKIPELLKQTYLGYLASDESVKESDIEDCKADPAFDKAVELVGNMTTMNVRLGTLDPNPGACRNAIIRQIEAARKQIAGN